MRGVFAALLLCALPATYAQSSYSSWNAHSHNDYAQPAPFELAYAARFGSIEVDICAVDGELLVAHGCGEVQTGKTLDAMYLQPIAARFRSNGNKAWPDQPGTYQLMIDIKSEAEPTLALLIPALNRYRDVFKAEGGIRIVITGNRPPPRDFPRYPDWIAFDGNLGVTYSPEQLQRVALISENFKLHANVAAAVAQAHGLGKRIRFWNAPDTPEAWRVLMSMRADFINTDHIDALANFLK
ncbi:MAG TPA: hypothetical protein VIT92_01605 [Burkholderiaceae bacterium]